MFAGHLLGLIHERSAALGDGMGPTASIGVGPYASSFIGQAILKAADGAMYRAKRACGDHVNVSEPKPTRASGVL